MTIEKILQTLAVAGQERFAFMNNSYTIGAEIYFFIHDVNKNIEMTKSYFRESLQGCDFSSCRLAYIIGTKTDIYLIGNGAAYQPPSDFINALMPDTLPADFKSKIDKNMVLLSNTNTESVTKLYNFIANDIYEKFPDKKIIKTVVMGRGGVGKTTTSKNLYYIGKLMSSKCGINPHELMTITPDLFLISFQYD